MTDCEDTAGRTEDVEVERTVETEDMVEEGMMVGEEADSCGALLAV